MDSAWTDWRTTLQATYCDARGGRGHHVGDIASVDEGGVERASR
jgi:hypothetical protein